LNQDSQRIRLLQPQRERRVCSLKEVLGSLDKRCVSSWSNTKIKEHLIKTILGAKQANLKPDYIARLETTNTYKPPEFIMAMRAKRPGEDRADKKYDYEQY
jgi:hypothetical protein